MNLFINEEKGCSKGGGEKANLEEISGGLKKGA